MDWRSWRVLFTFSYNSEFVNCVQVAAVRTEAYRLTRTIKRQWVQMSMCPRLKLFRLLINRILNLMKTWMHQHRPSIGVTRPPQVQHSVVSPALSIMKASAMSLRTPTKQVSSWRITSRVMCGGLILPAAPCGIRGCKNRPTLFPGQMSYKVTKPGFLCVVFLSVLILYCCLLGPLLCIASFHCYVFCFLVVLAYLSVLAKWLARKTPLRKPNCGEGIVSRKPRPKSAYDLLGLLYCFIVILCVYVVSWP